MEASGLPVKTSGIEVGDRIVIVFHKTNSFDKGEIKFIGALGKKKKDVWYGIALDKAKGKHDGKGYFKTEKNHATFVMLKHLRKLTSEDFDMKAFRRQLKEEAAKKKRAQLEKRNSNLPRITEEKDEDAASSSRRDTGRESLRESVRESNVRESIRESVTTLPRASILGRDDPQVQLKVKEIEKNYDELLKKKEKEIIGLKNKVRMIEQKKNKEISKLQVQMASGDASGKLGKTLKEKEGKISNMTIEIESLKAELENAKLEVEESEIKIQELEYDKEILLLQADITTEAEEDEMDPEEMRKNYGYIKMAFTRLEEKYELEKEEWELKMEEMKLEGEGDIMKNEDVNRMLNEKNKQIEELKERLDEYSETEKYIESLTEQILNKDSELSQLDMQCKELRTSLEINEEMINELEEMNNMLQLDFEEKELDAMELEEKVVQMESQKKEDDGTIAKYREKLRTIQGEIDIIKTQNSDGDDSEKVEKIDQLIKNYTATLQEKRNLVKELVNMGITGIKELKRQKKWTIILRSFPDSFVNALNPMLLDKFFNLGEIADQVVLIINHLRNNYLKTPIILEDNIGLVDFICDLVQELSKTQSLCEYVFDYGFSLKKVEDFKSLLRSNIFVMLKSSVMLLNRLLTEIREDTFSLNFNYNMLKENNENILKFCSDITNEFSELKNKDSIDIRTKIQYVDVLYLTYSGYLMNKNVSEEKFVELTKRLDDIKHYILFNESWMRSENRRQGSNEYGESKYNLQEVTDLEGALMAQREAIKAEGADVKAVVESIFDNVRNYCIKNGKKLKIDDDDDHQSLLDLIAKDGPWQETVISVREKLEMFEFLNKENAEMRKKVDELNQEIGVREQKLQNFIKVKSNLETRVKELELKCQSLPFMQKENKRLQEKEKHLSDAFKRVKDENELMKKKLREGGGRSKLASALSDGSDGSSMKNPHIFQKIQKAAKSIGLVRFNAGSTNHKSKDYTFREKFEIYSLDNTIRNLTGQVMKMKSRSTMEVVKKIEEEMPHFNHFLKRASQENDDDTVKNEAEKAILKVKGITSAVKQAISSSKLVDCTPKDNENSISRILRLNKFVKRQEAGVKSCFYRANKIMDDFRVKWSRAQLLSGKSVHSNKLLREKLDGKANEVVGRISFNPDPSAPDEASKTRTLRKIIFNPSVLQLNQALKF